MDVNHNPESRRDPPVSTRPRNTPPGKAPCLPLRISPLLFVLVGSVLTVLGHSFQSLICKIAGPVTVAIGGLLLLFLTVWSSRESQPKGNTIDVESRQGSVEAGNLEASVEGCFTLESYTNEMIPPSYEEAISSGGDSRDSSADNTPPPEYCDTEGQDSNSAPSEPPSYEDSVVERGTTTSPASLPS